MHQQKISSKSASSQLATITYLEKDRLSLSGYFHDFKPTSSTPTMCKVSPGGHALEVGKKVGHAASLDDSQCHPQILTHVELRVKILNGPQEKLWERF